MKKIIVKYVAILTFILIFGARIYVLIVAGWDYFHTEEICLDSQTPFAMTIYEIKPYTVVTDQGNMYLGDEYMAIGPIGWDGSADLLWISPKGAVFLSIYRIDDPTEGFSSGHCRWFVSSEDYPKIP